MLMDQFAFPRGGVYPDCPGAQNGLTKRDSLDTINEYSVHFKQAGFDVESMFNMLINGTESGTFPWISWATQSKNSFIRAKDGSDSTIGAFQKIRGLTRIKMTKKFAEGGTSAYEAYQTVNEALFNLNDTVTERNWRGPLRYDGEDLGAEGVQALTNS